MTNQVWRLGLVSSRVSHPPLPAAGERRAIAIGGSATTYRPGRADLPMFIVFCCTEASAIGIPARTLRVEVFAGSVDCVYPSILRDNQQEQVGQTGQCLGPRGALSSKIRLHPGDSPAPTGHLRCFDKVSAGLASRPCFQALSPSVPGVSEPAGPPTMK